MLDDGHGPSQAPGRIKALQAVARRAPQGDIVGPRQRQVDGGADHRRGAELRRPIGLLPVPLHAQGDVSSRAISSHDPPAPRSRKKDPDPERSNGLLAPLDSDAALHAAWARRAGMISNLPRPARVAFLVWALLCSSLSSSPLPVCIGTRQRLCCCRSCCLLCIHRVRH